MKMFEKLLTKRLRANHDFVCVGFLLLILVLLYCCYFDCYRFFPLCKKNVIDWQTDLYIWLHDVTIADECEILHI